MKIEFQSRLSADEVGFADKEGKAAEIYWQTTKPFYVYVKDDALNKVVEVIIPEYFVTDFCSVPKIPFAYLMFGDIGRRAGLLHDALYSPWIGIQACDLFTREPFVIERPWADTVLRNALIACGVPGWKAAMMYMGVKLFGNQYFHGKPICEQGIYYDQSY